MLAHALTALRLLLAIPAALALATPDAYPPWAPLGFILTAIATDFFDGRVARVLGTASAAGQLFDHATDCLFVTSALVGAAFFGAVTPLLPPLVLLAFAQYVLDSRFLHRQKQLRMSMIGRWNGILYFAPPLLQAQADFIVGTHCTQALGICTEGSRAIILFNLAYWFSWALVLSTLVSIADRALARPAPLSTTR